jgi:hypothetical protein
MTKATFADLKRESENACAFLQSFALGRSGFTQRDARAGVQRLSDLCDRLKDFASGPNAEEATAVTALARSSIAGANARLASLRDGR